MSIMCQNTRIKQKMRFVAKNQPDLNLKAKVAYVNHRKDEGADSVMFGRQISQVSWGRKENSEKSHGWLSL